jgi:hypothetical protein
MERPVRFEEHRYLGDKRNQRAYDLDSDGPALVDAVNELIRSEQFAAFSPDTLDEARNRGYRLATSARR